ncbi:MAG: AbrB family transcriptional regulator [Trichococcus flocculiformis]|uniref:AbrB family transcriptional regulator n=1 Tax=Trichococcus flocculiformis TaxID=82803 RepID=A0A847D2F8_9LACT|nr:AbrB family transcriptional regulator [Trichococcus flocculiformis]NLD30785.1 AbrB family transcriptional regulator [Trichococcus flocculiformis]
MNFGKLLGTLIVAFIGCWAGIRFRVPAGGMIGSLVAVAIYNYFSQMGYMPANLKIIGQIIIGGTIGMNFTKSSLAEMKQVFFPAVISVVILLTVGVIAGYILHKVAGIDLITALLGTSSGGLTDMTILAAAFEADTIIVSSIHLVRPFSVILLMPIFVRIISTYINK